MGKIIRMTEADLAKLVKKAIQEQTSQQLAAQQGLDAARTGVRDAKDARRDARQDLRATNRATKLAMKAIKKIFFIIDNSIKSKTYWIYVKTIYWHCPSAKEPSNYVAKLLVI